MSEPDSPPAGRFILAIGGLFFAAIGITFAVAFSSFPAPAPFVAIRWLFGGFFAIFGVTMAISAIAGKPLKRSGGVHTTSFGPRRRRSTPRETFETPETPQPGQYACPHCSAALGADADISPSGDVKCPYCQSWFNVRNR